MQEDSRCTVKSDLNLAKCVPSYDILNITHFSYQISHQSFQILFDFKSY